MSERYGPQTAQIEALLVRARNLTDKEAEALAVRLAALNAAWAAQDAAWNVWCAACAAARTAALNSWAAQDAAWDAQYAAQDSGWAARNAVLALAVRDLIGQHGFTQQHYDTLVAPWETVMGTEWTRETSDE